MSSIAKMIVTMIVVLAFAVPGYGFKTAGPIYKYHPSANGQFGFDAKSGSIIDLVKNEEQWRLHLLRSGGYFFISNDGQRVIQVSDKNYGHCYWDLSSPNSDESKFEQKYCVFVYGPDGLIKKHRLADLCRSLDYDWFSEIFIGTDFFRTWLESATLDGDVVKVKAADYRMYTVSFQDGEIKSYRRIYSLFWLWPYFVGITIMALIVLPIIFLVKKWRRKGVTSARPLLP